MYFVNADNIFMPQKRMKLSEFARQENLTYGTVYKYWKAGLLEGQQISTGTILVSGYKNQTFDSGKKRVILYARISEDRTPADLDKQLQQLDEYALAQDYTIVDKIKEVGSGYSNSRSSFMEILSRTDWDILLVENKEIPVKFGFDYLQMALMSSGRSIHYRTNFNTSSENILLAMVKHVESLLKLVYGPGLHRKPISDAINRIKA
jgi:predicted site-specific integrase-resolvase